MSTYDPYTYQPLLRFFYKGDANGSHGDALESFAQWMKQTHPQAFADLMKKRPDLLNSMTVVSSGSVGVSGLAGLGDASSVYADSQTDPMTEWGTKLFDLAKGWMQYDTQRELLTLNISRAERGLPPISGSAVAPQVNVGVSPEVQQLGMIAVGGLIIVGLLAAARKR